MPLEGFCTLLLTSIEDESEDGCYCEDSQLRVLVDARPKPAAATATTTNPASATKSASSDVTLVRNERKLFAGFNCDVHPPSTSGFLIGFLPEPLFNSKVPNPFQQSSRDFLILSEDFLMAH